MSFVRGETLADVEKAKARAERELNVARAAEHDAGISYEVALEDGAGDETLRAAVDKRMTAGWQVSRLTKRIAALDSKRVELLATARAALLQRLRGELADAAESHGAAAAVAATTAARFVQARGALDVNGFSREASEVEPFPLFVYDSSPRYSSGLDLATHDLLDRWRWKMAEFKRSLQVQVQS